VEDLEKSIELGIPEQKVRSMLERARKGADF